MVDIDYFKTIKINGLHTTPTYSKMQKNYGKSGVNSLMASVFD